MITNSLNAPKLPTMADFAAEDQHIFTDRLEVQSTDPDANIHELDSLLDTARAMAALKSDLKETATGLKLDEKFQLVIPGAGNMPLPPYPLNDNAISQMYNKLTTTVWGPGTTKGFPKDFLENIDPDIRAAVVNRQISKISSLEKDREWFIRTYDGHVRAVLGQNYAVVDNLPLLEIIRTAVEKRPSAGMRLVRPHLSADDMTIRILYKDVTVPGSPDNGGSAPKRYGFGAVITNGEAGGRSLGVYPFAQTHSCTNSTIFKSDGAVHFIHTGDPEVKLLAVMQAIAVSFELAAQGLHQLLEAHAHPLPDFDDVLGGLARDYGWSEDTTRAIAIGTGGDRSKGGLIDGVTAAAWQLFKGNEETAMEMKAGELLAAPDSLFAKAAASYREIKRKEEAVLLQTQQQEQARQNGARRAWGNRYARR